MQATHKFRRTDVKAWLEHHGFDWQYVATSPAPRIEFIHVQGDEAAFLTLTVMKRGDNGKPYVDADTKEIATAEVTVPLQSLPTLLPVELSGERPEQ